MGMMIEKLRSLLHETMIIYIRNSLPDMQTYLLENIGTIVTIEDAVRWSEHYEHAQTKIPTMKVSVLSMESMEEREYPDCEARQEIDAFGRQTGNNFRRRGNFGGGSSRGYRRVVGIG